MYVSFAPNGDPHRQIHINTDQIATVEFNDGIANVYVSNGSEDFFQLDETQSGILYNILELDNSLLLDRP